MTMESFEPQDENLGAAIKPFCPSDDDVLRGAKHVDPVLSFRAFKLALNEKLNARKEGVDHVNGSLLGDGHRCELLSSTTGDGWRKGKLQISIEFIPDAPEEGKS